MRSRDEKDETEYVPKWICETLLYFLSVHYFAPEEYYEVEFIKNTC